MVFYSVCKYTGRLVALTNHIFCMTYIHMLLKCCIYFVLLTLSHIQQICSRGLWKHLEKNWENFYQGKFDYWKELKNIVANGKIAQYEQFVLLPQCFQRASVSVCMWARVNTFLKCTSAVVNFWKLLANVLFCHDITE